MFYGRTDGSYAPNVRGEGQPTEQGNRASFCAVPSTEVLAALDGIGHIGYRERQMWEPFGLAKLEPELSIPVL